MSVNFRPVTRDSVFNTARFFDKNANGILEIHEIERASNLSSNNLLRDAFRALFDAVQNGNAFADPNGDRKVSYGTPTLLSLFTGNNTQGSELDNLIGRNRSDVFEARDLADRPRPVVVRRQTQPAENTVAPEPPPEPAPAPAQPEAVDAAPEPAEEPEAPAAAAQPVPPAPAPAATPEASTPAPASIEAVVRPPIRRVRVVRRTTVDTADRTVSRPPQARPRTVIRRNV